MPVLARFYTHHPTSAPAAGGKGEARLQAVKTLLTDILTLRGVAHLNSAIDAVFPDAADAGAGELLSMHEQIMAACEEADEAAAVREAEGEPE